MIFLPGPGGVDGLFFGLGLLLGRRLLGGWNGGNRTQHHEGKYQRDQTAHLDYAYCRCNQIGWGAGIA